MNKKRNQVTVLLDNNERILQPYIIFRHTSQNDGQQVFNFPIPVKTASTVASKCERMAVNFVVHKSVEHCLNAH